jgi:hypothetical protein
MPRRLALPAFLAVCLALALLMIFQRVTPMAGSLGFALALVIFGIASRGFRR